MDLDFCLATDSEVGEAHYVVALKELYRTDKGAFLRHIDRRQPRPATAPPDTGDSPQEPIHVNQLFAMLEREDAAATKVVSSAVRPPLPAHADASREAHDSGKGPQPDCSGMSEKWVRLPGVSRPVDFGVRGQDTGDALVDILGEEQAAYVRSEWRGKGEPAPEAEEESPPVDEGTGLVRMNDVQIVDPRDL